LRNLRWASLFIFAGVLGCAAAWGQAVSTSQIKGTVADQTGLAIPGAEVKLTQTETGLVRSTTTNVEGAYLLPDLPVGPYQLEVTKPGFSEYLQTGITLQVATNPTIEVFLEVGQENNLVQVEANASMVETQSSGVGQVIDSQKIVDLPLIGRQVSDLIGLAGAATAGSDPNQLSSRNYPNIQSYSVAGGLATGTTYVLDGSLHNDVYTNANLPLPFPDALLEFKVETSALQAQYGMHSAATVNALTKSGGNEWHGGAFEFVRNYLFDARQLFASTPDTLKRNQFGGMLGGPIIMDKLFFFASYQQTDTRQSPNATVSYVPTAAELMGDFSTVTSKACQETPIQLRNPLAGDALFPNNQIPIAQLSAPALAIAKLLPVPQDQQCGRTTYGTQIQDNEHFGVAKVDYTLSPGHTLFARYLGTQDDQPSPYRLSKNLLTTQASGYDDFDQSFTVGDTYLIKGSMVNNFRATVDRTAIARVAPSFFGPQSVGIDMYSYLPNFTSVSLPAPYFSIGSTTATPATYRTTTLQSSEDFGIVRGNHQLGFGANLSHWNSNTYANVLATGALSFTGQGFTGFALSDFFTGNLSGLTEAAPNTLFVRDWYIGLYAQDAWKVKPGLIINYGVRWEPFLPMTFANGDIYHFSEAAFLAGTHTTQFANAPPGLSYPGDPGFPGKAGLNAQWNQFAPRIGMVWDPKANGRMSIRASYGIFYDTIPAQYNLNTETAPPWGARTTLTNPPGGLANPFGGIPGGNPFPLTFNASAPFSLYGTYNTYDYNTHPTYVQQWNVSVERQVGANWLVRASYLGNEMVHLLGARELNPAVYMGTGPCTLGGTNYSVCSTLANTNQRRLLSTLNPATGKYFGYVDTWDDSGTGSYNGMLLSAQKRLGRSVIMSANYTYSHCISDPVNTLPNAGSGGSEVYIFPGRTADRGNCNTSGDDRRHVANLTAVAEMPKITNNKWVTMILTGWRGSAAATLQSGSFFTVTTGEDNALTGVGGQRPMQVMSNVYGNNTLADWVNPAAFAFPPPGQYGNSGPGTIRGPGLLGVNVGLSRPFRIRERQTIEIRVESQNVLNHTNLGPPILTMNSPLFGQITTSGPARIMQFALKYAF
jgi:Carboxypeptidase regulatory-like domain